MRAAPIGVVYRVSRLDELVRGAYECSIPTHGGQLAISGAAAVAGAVSAALEGLRGEEVLAVAVQAAKGEMAEAIERTYSDLKVDEVAAPFEVRTIVPLAISLAVITESAEETALIAANLGGDADSVASIGGAIAGAIAPETVNQEWVAVVSAVNGDDLRGVAGALAALHYH
jgi:ADP-ribosylglycohydrolase